MTEDLKSQKQHTPTEIETLIKAASLVYILLVVCSFGYNYFYYAQFGINITEYVDFGESLLMFLPILTDVFFFSLLAAVLYFLMQKRFLFGMETTLFGSPAGLQKVYITMFTLLSIVTSVIFLLSKITGQFQFLFIIFFVLTIVLFLPNVIEIGLQKSNSSLPKSSRVIFYIFLMTFTLVSFRGYSKSSAIKRNKDYNPFTIVFKNNKIFKSTPAVSYVGRTRNYIFLSKIQSGHTHVINVSDIKEYIISE